MSIIKSGTLYIVATPIGNLADISLRAIEILNQVDLICSEDTRKSQYLLQAHGIKNKQLSLHEHNERERCSMLIEQLKTGVNIALISDAGTPLISDPGYLLVNACRQQQIQVSPIPGACAFVSALSIAGIATDQFCFYGFLPRKGARKTFLSTLVEQPMTLIFYEASHRIEACFRDINELFESNRYITICRELTKIHEHIYSGTLAAVKEQLEADKYGFKGEFVIVLSGQLKQKRSDIPPHAEKMLIRLFQDLPLKKAAAITAELTGIKKNTLYQFGLTLK